MHILVGLKLCKNEIEIRCFTNRNELMMFVFNTRAFNVYTEFRFSVWGGV